MSATRLASGLFLISVTRLGTRLNAPEITGNFCTEKRLVNCRASVSDARRFRETPYDKRLRSIASSSRFRIIIDQPLCHAVGVFPEDAFTFDPVDQARSFVIPSLDANEGIIAVHEVRLAINHRTTIKPRGQQIARIHVSAHANFRRAVRRWIFVSWKPGLASHC